MEGYRDRIPAVLASSGGVITSVAAVTYICGYPALRTHLSVLGIRPELRILDDQYFYWGANFFVWLIPTVQGLVALVLLSALLFVTTAAVASIALRLLGRERQKAVRDILIRRWAWLGEALRHPYAASIFGVVLTTTVNVFLSTPIRDAPSVLQGSGLDMSAASAVISYQLVGIITIALVLPLLLISVSQGRATGFGRLLNIVFVVLVAWEAFLLPMNYGVFVSSTVSLPKVVDGGFSPGEKVWLIWQDNSSIWFLTDDPNRAARNIVVVRKDEVKRLRLEGDEPLMSIISARHRPPGR